MKKDLKSFKGLIFILLLTMVGCSQGYTEKDLENAYNEGYSDAEEETYDSAFQDGYDEGYGIGYGDAEVDLEKSSVKVTGSLPGNNLSLASNGFDWMVKTDLTKRQFIDALAKENGEFLSMQESENIVKAIDVYYNSNSKSKSIGDVIEDLKRGS